MTTAQILRLYLFPNHTGSVSLLLTFKSVCLCLLQELTFSEPSLRSPELPGDHPATLHPLPAYHGSSVRRWTFYSSD